MARQRTPKARAGKSDLPEAPAEDEQASTDKLESESESEAAAPENTPAKAEQGVMANEDTEQSAPEIPEDLLNEIGELTIPQLRVLVTEAYNLIREKEQTVRDQALQDARAAVAKLGLDPNLVQLSLFPGQVSSAGRKKRSDAGVPPQPKYRHPDPAQAHVTWSGRGRPPEWIREYEVQHGEGSREQLLIKEAEQATGEAA